MEIKKRVGRPRIYESDDVTVRNKLSQQKFINKTRNNNHGIIYKVSGFESEICYIGSTTFKLQTRIEKHEHNYECYKNGTYNFVSIFELFDKLGMYDLEYKVIENVRDLSKLKDREGYYISLNKQCVNQRNESSETGDIKVRKLNFVPEVTKLRNRKHYLKTRDTRLAQSKIKVVCTCCNRSVQQEKLKRHIQTNLCKNTIKKQVAVDIITLELIVVSKTKNLELKWLDSIKSK